MAVPPMKKPAGGAKPSSPAAPFKDSKFESLYPCLYGMLTTAKWDDGDERRTSTLLFFVEEGTIKACLNDRALGCSAFFSGEAFGKLLEIIEEKLADGTADWRRHKS